MIVYLVITALSVIVSAIILVAAWSLPAQEISSERVLECIGEIREATFSPHLLPEIRALTPEDMGVLNLLTGEDMWLGYDQGGYITPDDTILLFKLRGTGEDGQPVEVWVYGAESAPDEVYWFSFRDTSLFADANGEHYGPHPCGIYRVRRWPVVLWLIRLVGRGS